MNNVTYVKIGNLTFLIPPPPQKTFLIVVKKFFPCELLKGNCIKKIFLLITSECSFNKFDVSVDCEAGMAKKLANIYS